MNKVSNIIKEKRTEKKYKKYAHKSFGPPSGAGQGERGTRNGELGRGFRLGLDWAMHSVDDFKIVSGQQVKLAPPLRSARGLP